jgi:hypothetical protein
MAVMNADVGGSMNAEEWVVGGRRRRDENKRKDASWLNWDGKIHSHE